MLQHAGQFSFDRLKFIVPAAIILSLAFAKFNNKGRLILLIAITLSSINGALSYKNDILGYSEWTAIDAKNKK